MDRFAVIDADGFIVNTIVAKAGTNWTPGEGLQVLPEADALAAGHQPRPAPAPRVLTPRQFMDRLGADKQGAAAAAAQNMPELLLVLLRLAAATEVDLDHPETSAGIGMMRRAGVLTDAEAEALRA